MIVVYQVFFFKMCFEYVDFFNFIEDDVLKMVCQFFNSYFFFLFIMVQSFWQNGFKVFFCKQISNMKVVFFCVCKIMYKDDERNSVVFVFFFYNM